jgi:hypothetical protein
MPQFYQEILADGAITTTVTGVTLRGPPSEGASVVSIIFVSTPGGSEITALDTLIQNHVPSQGGYPSYTPTPNEVSSLTGTSEFVWTDASGANIVTMDGDTILMDNVMEVPRITAAEVPGVSDANHSILYVDSTTGLLMQVEFGGASGPVGGGGGGSVTELANTGVGANVFLAKPENTGYFRSITGVNAHTIVTEGPSSISVEVPFASQTTTGAVRFATDAEVTEGLTGDIAISPTGLAQWTLSSNTIPRYEIEFTATVTTSSTTDVLMEGPMEIVNPIAGTYLVSFSTSCSVSNNQAVAFVSIYVGGVKNAASERETANNKAVVAATQAIVFVNGAQNIDIRWRVTTASVTSPGPRILSALRIGS